MTPSLPRISALALTLLLPYTSAFAGSQSLDCVSRDKSATLAAGNSGLETQIKFVDKEGKPAVFHGNAKIMPEFDYSSSEDDKTIMAIPTSRKNVLRNLQQTMKVTHKDGSVCYGRQRWDITYTQNYILSGKDGDMLRYKDPFRDAKRIPGLTRDGYILHTFTCHSYGVTTAGGCFVEDDSDIVEWIDDDKIDEGK
jgi:hypothetical protein